MPKPGKTHKGAAKRFRITRKGKVMRRRAFKSHLMTGKPGRRKRALSKPATVSPGEEKRIKRLLLS
ncbi:50S ribosomal protein L35 [bacterium]|nr:MAG: 50S ribosomal protein L35 [bacterium]RKZ27029.1 MAG: 50S ribosomal protein L35 [bacterium]